MLKVCISYEFICIEINLLHVCVGMSTRSLPPTVLYTLEFNKFEQIRGKPIHNDEPQFHYMQTGGGNQIMDPKTHKLVPAPEPKRPQLGQLYLALLNEPQQIKQLVEITPDDIDSLRAAAAAAAA